MVVECIGVGEREDAKAVFERLGKTRYGDSGSAELISWKGRWLAAICEEKLTGKMAFVGLQPVHIGDELIFIKTTGGTERGVRRAGRPSDDLGRRNHKTTT